MGDVIFNFPEVKYLVNLVNPLVMGYGGGRVDPKEPAFCVQLTEAIIFQSLCHFQWTVCLFYKLSTFAVQEK